MPVSLPLAASRNVDFGPTIELFYFGDPLPLTGAAVSMQWRLYAGAAGEPELDLPTITFEDEAAATTARPDRRVLRLIPDAAKETLTALPGLNTPEAGSPQYFRHDIIITYADSATEKLAYGPIILWPGVTVNG